MIKDIPFSLLEPEELALLAGRLREMGEKSGITEGLFLRLLEVLKVDEERIRKVLNRDRTNRFTEVLREKDCLRDRTFVLFRDLSGLSPTLL